MRANGSRGCAPDDRLREAIHRAQERMDCFVATLLAKTTNTASFYWLHFRSGSQDEGLRPSWGSASLRVSNHEATEEAATIQANRKTLYAISGGGAEGRTISRWIPPHSVHLMVQYSAPARPGMTRITARSASHCGQFDSTGAPWVGPPSNCHMGLPSGPVRMRAAVGCAASLRRARSAG